MSELTDGPGKVVAWMVEFKCSWVELGTSDVVPPKKCPRCGESATSSPHPIPLYRHPQSDGERIEVFANALDLQMLREHKAEARSFNLHVNSFPQRESDVAVIIHGTQKGCGK